MEKFAAPVSIVVLFILDLAFCYVEAAAAAANTVELDGKQTFIPTVAFKCGFRNKYFDRHGRWLTDEDRFATCLKGKLDILKYCRKVYPDLEVTNIVESSHYHKIGNWCKEEGSPCKWTHTIRPFRCIVGEFQSEALLVPQGCRFGHVDDRQMCEEFKHWEQKATEECDKRNGGMDVRSFAMLAPCGLEMFSGVEFVCCERRTLRNDSIDLNVNAKLEEETKVKKEDDEDEDDDDYYDDDDDEEDYEDDEDEEQGTWDEEAEDDQDPYFRTADPDNEHDMYKASLRRLEDKHRAKVAKVMREWTELENRYGDMKKKDPKHAQDFKKEMTTRFQKTVSALEEENLEERRQTEDVHQQRVQATLNERKREAIKAYRDALALSLGEPQPHKVLKTLQAYIRAEEKDRTHSLNRYRHLLKTDREKAEEWRPELIRRLRDIDLRINGTIAMLHDITAIEDKIKPVILEFWNAYRKENTPELDDDSASGIGDADMTRRLVDELKAEYQQERKEQPTLVLTEPEVGTEETKPREEQHHKWEDPPRPFEAERLQTAHEHESKVVETSAATGSNNLLILCIGSGALLLTIVIGIVLIRRRTPAYDPVEVTTPEERHVAAMQISGYENPTYRFFDEKA